MIDKELERIRIVLVTILNFSSSLLASHISCNMRIREKRLIIATSVDKVGETTSWRRYSYFESSYRCYILKMLLGARIIGR